MAYNQNFIFNGLGTLSTKVSDAGPYFVEGHMSIPTLTDGGGESQVVVVVNQNGSPVYTGSAGAEGFRTDLNCAALDIISVVWTSSAPADQGLNVIKSVVSIGSGK